MALAGQSIIRAAGQLAFIVDEGQYTRDPDGSVPVLIESVSRIISNNLDPGEYCVIV